MWQRYRQQLSLRADLRDILVPPAKRIPVLDGLRAIGILLVIGLHSVFGISRIMSEENRAAYIAGLPGALDILWQARGSNIIFILCGLLVSLVLLREIDRSGGIAVRSFYRRRLVRILPMYVVGVLFFLLFDPGKAQYLWSNLLFISTLLPDQHTIVPVGWSMNIQVQFYALLPWLLLLLVRSRRPLQWLLALIVLAPLLRWLAVVLHPPLGQLPFHILLDNRDYARLYSDALYYKLHTRITPFLLGIAVAWVWHARPAAFCRAISQPLVNTLLLVAGAALVVTAARIGIHNPADPFYQPFDTAHNLAYLVLNEVQFSSGVCLLLLCALFPAGLAHALRALLSLRLWHPFSELVYGLYLFHFAWIAVAAVAVFRTLERDAITSVGLAQTGLVFALAVVFSLLFATVVSLFIEKPFMRMGKA